MVLLVEQGDDVFISRQGVFVDGGVPILIR